MEYLRDTPPEPRLLEESAPDLEAALSVPQEEAANYGSRMLDLIRNTTANKLGVAVVSAIAVGLGASASSSESEAATMQAADNPVAMQSNVQETNSATPRSHTRSNAVWSFFGDPRAVQLPGRGSTIAGWTTNGGSVKIGKFDRSGNQQIKTLDVIKPPDDHNNPSLHVIQEGENKGRIMVFYSQHAGRDLGRGTSQMKMRISEKPYSIKEWGPSRTIPTGTGGSLGYTYPNPVGVEGSNGKEEIQLHYRGDKWQPTYVTTRSDGKNWSKPRTLIQGTHNRGYGGRYVQRPYVKYDSQGDTTYAAFTNAHPSSYPTGIYFVKQENNKFYRADDTEIGTTRSLPLRLNQADKIYGPESGHGRAWIQDVAADDEGDPVVLYTRREPLGGDTYRYATFKDGAWEDRKIVSNNAIFNDYYTPGATLDHENPETVYLSRLADGKKNVEAWNTADEGKTWAFRNVSSPLKGNADYNGSIRPVVPRGMSGDERQVFWISGEYKGFRGHQFNTSLRYANVPTRDLTQDAQRLAGN